MKFFSIHFSYISIKKNQLNCFIIFNKFIEEIFCKSGVNWYVFFGCFCFLYIQGLVTLNGIIKLWKFIDYIWFYKWNSIYRNLENIKILISHCTFIPLSFIILTIRHTSQVISYGPQIYPAIIEVGINYSVWQCIPNWSMFY